MTKRNLIAHKIYKNMSKKRNKNCKINLWHHSILKLKKKPIRDLAHSIPVMHIVLLVVLSKRKPEKVVQKKVEIDIV